MHSEPKQPRQVEREDLMDRASRASIGRRQFLASVAAGSAGLVWTASRSRAAGSESTFLAGEGVVDTTPPVGIELGGFHRPPGKERRIAGIRQALR